MQDNNDAERLETFVFRKEETGKEVKNQMAKDERKDKSKPLAKDKIKCTVCGGVFAQRPDVRDKRINDVFGSAKKLEENYRCRECRKGYTYTAGKWVKAEKKEKPAKKKKKK